MLTTQKIPLNLGIPEVDPSPIVDGVQVPEPPRDVYTAKAVTAEQRNLLQTIRDKAAEDRKKAEDSHKTAGTPKKRKATSTPKQTPQKRSRRERTPSSSSSDEGSSGMSLYSDNHTSQYSISDSQSGSDSDSGSSSSGSSPGTPDDYPGASDAEDPEISMGAVHGSFGKDINVLSQLCTT